MQLLSQAEAALLRNWRVVCLYIVTTVVVVTVYGLAMDAMTEAVPEETRPKPFWYIYASIGLDLGQVGIIAALQAIALAYIGREMDQPLWKCAHWQDALKRFFSYWFIVNLIYVTSSKLSLSVPDAIAADFGVLMFFFRFMLTLVAVPLGACIMHGGGLHWKEIPGLLAPFFRLFDKTLLAIALGFLQYVILLSILAFVPEQVLKSVWLWSFVNAPLALLECLAFAVMWLVCMQYREVASEFEDDDFDF